MPLLQVPSFRQTSRTTRNVFERCRVGGAGRNAQFHFRSLIDFAPHRQLPFNQCGALPHPAQTIVSLKTMAGENRRIHALSVVAHAQSEFIVIADFNFYLLCLGVMESVAKRFGSNLVDLVTEDGMEVSAAGPQPLRGMSQGDDCLSRLRVPLRGCLWRARDHCVRLWKRAVPAPHPALP